jgi:ribonuclease P protein component
MPKSFSLPKESRIKKISEEMFGWVSCEVFEGVRVFYNHNNLDKNSILVMIPKKAVRDASKRNSLRRKTKEVFRLNVNRDKSADYLVKFNRFTDGFEEGLRKFFKDV